MNLATGSAANRPADSPAGHRVSLAHTGDCDRPIGEAGAKRGETRRLRVAVGELLVNLVGKHSGFGLEDHVGQRFQLCRDDKPRRWGWMGC